jgi:hypothetical protein
MRCSWVFRFDFRRAPLAVEMLVPTSNQRWPFALCPHRLRREAVVSVRTVGRFSLLQNTKPSRSGGCAWAILNHDAPNEMDDLIRFQ